MFKMTRIVLSAAVVTSSLMLTGNVYAENPKDTTTKGAAASPHVRDGKVQLGTYLCKDVMRLGGDDRDLSLTFMHGYWLGKKGATEFVANSLGKASDDFVEYCLDHPNDNALQSMEKFLK